MNTKELQNELTQLKGRIAEIEKQIKESGWVPYPGEIVEVSDYGEEWVVRRIASCDAEEEFPYRCEDGSVWKCVQQLSDPNIIQLRPHTPGDPQPCDDNTRVIYRLRNGDCTTEWAFTLDWGIQDFPATEIDAWAPV